ncbi:MAG TPA: hypothetical protein VFR03_16990 [Thermoanaerobaculia bacterium]|nr:hypothetical protein [Thermoanaerobaculia bacterium]
MAAPRSLTLFLAVLLALGCRGATPQPVARADQPKEEAKAPAAAVPPPSQAPEPSAPAAAPPRQGDAAPVVVDPGVDGSATPQTLVEASREEKERRAKAGKPIAVITDKTLPKYASKGQITVADPKKDKKAAKAPAPAPAVKDERYWRGRARELRENWKQAADEVKDLEQKSTALRQKFYSETDTFLRDTQIKPDWDRVLDRLRQARLDVEAAKQELSQLLEEGRVAGALPAWLDEGIEDEPADEAARKKEAPAVQSIEPPVITDDGVRNPPPGPEAPR